MDHTKSFITTNFTSITNIREGEVKFGQKMQFFLNEEDFPSYIQKNNCKYVLFGIPEDIGIRANFGRAGAATCWDTVIQAIANIQHNKFCKANQILVLGKLNVTEAMTEANTLNERDKADRKTLFKLVEKIDKEVAHIISIIIKNNKIPIVIGGGHNNSYGLIKGAALAYGKPINAINFDAHSDFRALEGRHSGNGFSYAFEEGFLKKYFIFGLHENYNSKNVLNNLILNKTRINYNTYEEIAVRETKNFDEELKIAHNFIKNDFFGIEIDLDALPNIASSAMTLSGFSVQELRKFISFFGKSKQATYLHICEAAPSLADEKNSELVGKLIGYLVTDFLKSNQTI